MAHTFLALDMLKIPQETKDNVPTFWMGLFSNDGIKDSEGSWVKEPSRMLIDGYNDNNELVHPMPVLRAWTQWATNPDEVIQTLLDTAEEYTKEEIKAAKIDVDSIWYVEPEELI
jgi:hypothetical protein